MTMVAGIDPSRDPIDPKVGESDTIAVLPRHWRRGVGSVLMERCLNYLNEESYHWAVVWTVAGHDQGIGFFRKFGWQLDGVARDDRRHVRLRRVLKRQRVTGDSIGECRI